MYCYSYVVKSPVFRLWLHLVKTSMIRATHNWMCVFSLFGHEMSSKVAYFSLNWRNFQYCQPAQNQPKSQILFHKNGSPRDLYIMTLIVMQELWLLCKISFFRLCFSWSQSSLDDLHTASFSNFHSDFARTMQCQWFDTSHNV